METLSALSALWGEPPFTVEMVSNAAFYTPVDVSLNKLLDKQSSCNWFEAPWHLCDITKMSVTVTEISEVTISRMIKIKKEDSNDQHPNNFKH